MCCIHKNRDSVYLQNRTCYFPGRKSPCGSAPSRTVLMYLAQIMCICHIYRLYVWPINNVSQACYLCVSNIKSEPMDRVFVFAIHRSKGSGQMRCKTYIFTCRDKFVKWHISQFLPQNGSPWLATGSYFVRTEPCPSRSLLYTSRTKILD